MQDTKYSWCHGDGKFSGLLYLMAKCLLCTIGRVAQWIRRPTSNRKIVGSIPIVVILHTSGISHYNLGYRSSSRWLVVDSFSIVGSVVEFSPATRETGVRFPDNAG